MLHARSVLRVLAALVALFYAVTAADLRGNESEALDAATVAAYSANKALTTPASPIVKDFRYDDSKTGEEDSVAVWVDTASPENSLLFLTHKSANKVTVWSLTTNQIVRTLTGFNRPNGVAVDAAEETVYVADRYGRSVKKYFIADIRAGSLLPALVFGRGFSKSPEPMGVTVYHDAGASLVYVTYVGSSTRYIRAFTAGGALHRQWSVGSVVLESIKADDENRLIYVADEGANLIKVYRPDGAFVRNFGAGVFGGSSPDPEGIEIYGSGGDGYIIVSDQKANEFEIFDRKTFQNLARFKIADALDTDGIAITPHALPNYPQGGFFAQSRDRYVEGVRWEKIAAATKMSICPPLTEPPPSDLPPAAPSGLAAGGGEGCIDLAWSANTESDLAGYAVYRSPAAGSGFTLLRNGLTAPGFRDLAVAAGTTYHYVVTAVDAARNESAPSNEASAAPLDLPPAAPASLAAAGEVGAIVLDWADGGEPDLASYSVYRSASPGGTFALLANGLTASAFTDTAVTPGTALYYVVTATDLGGNESEASEMATAAALSSSPPPPPPPPPPPEETLLTLEWSPPTTNADGTPLTDLAGYRVHQGLQPGQFNSTIDVGNVLEHTFAALPSGTHYFAVSAYDTSGNESVLSTPIAATVP